MSPQEIAEKYIGETEKPQNAGFTDELFEKKMKAVGFEKGFAWCALFTELVFKEAFPDKFAELDKLFSAGTVQTFKNFQKESYPISNTPVPGYLVIWQSYKDGKKLTTGHAGIVSEVIDANTWYSIEGNTNDAGYREGYIVAKKLRKIVSPITGLRVMGFINVGI